jgi:soluble lytic murein transglycosylase
MRGFKNFTVLILVLLVGTNSAVPQPLKLAGTDPFLAFRLYNLSPTPRDWTEASKNFQTIFDSQKAPDVRAKMAFALGIMSYKNGDFVKAANYLGESINLKTHLDDYAHYYIGLIERDNKDLNGARLHFTSVKNHQPPSSREADAEIQLAQIAKIQNHWEEAYQLLAHLERKHRHDPQYQDIVYNLLEAALQGRHSFEACRASARLYSRFAPYSLSHGWGFDLSKAKVGDKDVRCSVTVKDQDRRMEQLLNAGEFEEVRSELKEWMASAKNPESVGHVEMELGQLALAEGKSKEAIDHLLNAQDKLKNNLTVQMLLSKAYAQSDDYPSAVENYLKASQMGPRFGRKATLAQKALFQAAFLSYQYRNYDGAARIFETIARQGRGQFVWDAKWHLAWIRYLKGDYEGAKKEFTELSHNRHFSAVDQEKLTYWRAMSEYRDGNLDEAKSLFTDLAKKSRLGYYTGAAQARLASIWPAAPAAMPAPPQVSSPPSPSATPAPEVSQRKPASEETLSADKEVEKLDEGTNEDEEAGVTDSGPFELGPPITSLRSQAMVDRFERAKDLIDLGFNSWALLELREIERRTTNRGYLQSLMAEYSKAGDFSRSATIADNVFETERVQGGITGSFSLWTYAFPEAYSHFVISDGKKYEVPPSLVWSVMRGESGFREDIHSQAGAMGLMQLIIPTAKKVAQGLGLSDFKNSMLLTPETNILLGTKYLKRLDKVMTHNLPLIIASYNAGPHRVKGWLKDFGDLDLDEFVEHIPYVETRNYVKKVMRNYFVYETLYEKKENPLSCLAGKPTIKFEGPKPTSESWEEL